MIVMSRSVFRKPSLKKSLSAKYKGAYTRKVKKALIPGYGTKAAGWLHPKRKLYNKVYNQTSIDTRKVVVDALNKTNTSTSRRSANNSDAPKIPAGFWDAVMIVIAAHLLATGHVIWAILFILIIGWHVVSQEQREDEQ